MDDDNDSSRSPAGAPPAPRSLLSRKAMGGIHASAGFRAQTRFIAIRVAKWLSDPQFVGFHPEGLEDVDAHFEVEGRRQVQHCQVKVEQLGAAKVREIVEHFRDELGSSGRALVIAGPKPSDQVRQLADALVRVRDARLSPHQRDHVDLATDENLSILYQRADLEDLRHIIAESVEFDFDFASILSDHSAAVSRLAGDLGRLQQFAGFTAADMRFAAEALLKAMHENPSKHWSVDDLHGLIHGEVETRRRGAVAGRGTVLVVAHESRAAVSEPPSALRLPDDLEERTRVPISLKASALSDLPQPELRDLESACWEVANPSAPFRQQLGAHLTAPVVYYGFPHIPLAMLSGVILGSQRQVRVLEHSYASGRFEWGGADPITLEPLDVTTSEGKIVVLRVSVSAAVDRELAKPPEGPPGLELHIRTPVPMRALVADEPSARAVATATRRALDQHVAGRTYDSLHIYAAVPVSVAVLIGRALGSTGLPPTYVYNFHQRARPPYSWRVRVDDALSVRPAVEHVVGRS